MRIQHFFSKRIGVGLIALSLAVCGFSQSPTIQKYIMVDQFGYRPGDPKMAVIVDPQYGFNEADSYTPGETLTVFRLNDNKVVFTGKIETWNDGAVDFTSGDKGWWFDFSSVKDTGNFYILDPKNNMCSYTFRIADNVYSELLKVATKVFFYQREAFNKEAKYAGDWADGPCFIGPGQDKECRYLYDKNNAKTARDLSGGWIDAGDYNKYVTLAESPIHYLLTAYDQNPSAFTDDIGIPESGNGLPDVIDETKFELEWLKKMQDTDGGSFIKVGSTDWSAATPPSSDTHLRYYGPKCSSSSISNAAMFAHAYLVLSKVPGQSDYANDLKTRAIKAWEWYQNNPKCDTCDSQEIKAGDADKSILEQGETEVMAAIYLFAITGEEKYNKVVKNKFAVMNSFYDRDFSMYFSFELDALMYYITLPNADKNVKEVVLAKRAREGRVTDVYQYHPRYDLYAAYIPFTLYTWGSSNTRCATASANYDYIYYKLDPANTDKYLKRTLGIVHYMHGINPFSTVYITNMGQYGAESSLTEMFHAWFSANSKFKNHVPPGYLTGGPNHWYTGTWADIKVQPPQKAYRDSGAGWPECSWELTEPAIYYQASYIKLISKFVK